MKKSHVFMVQFGDDSTTKGVGLRAGEKNIAEIFVSDLVLDNGQTIALGDQVPAEVDYNIFLLLGFKDRKDWKNFVGIINSHDKKFDEYFGGSTDAEAEEKEI